MIKAVVFDVGGVLLTLGEGEYRKEMAKCLGLSDMSQYEAEVPELQTGRKREQEVWDRLAGRPVQASEFAEAWRAHFVPIEGTHRLARTLQQMGIRTAVLSNTQPSHVVIMHEIGFLPGFDPVAFSCEIGYRKPEPGAYQWIIDALKLPPGNIVFIDDVAEYVEAACASGIHGIQHTGNLEATVAKLNALMDGALLPYM